MRHRIGGAQLKKNGELPKRVRKRTSKYLNNGIEQDHRRVKHRIRAMVGLKSFSAAGVTISGIELTEKIRKRQFKIGKLGGSKAMMPEIWRAALAA
jgi:transposase-like protein